MDNAVNREAVLQHWGIKGQKWGQRRFQNKDGSLTPEGRKRYSASDVKEKEAEETVEQRRARLLKSSDASELYKNRDLLTTAEINERLNRIDTEKRLEKAAEESKPVKKTFTEKVDGALKVGKKINEVYEFTNTPVMKALKKKLGIEKEEAEKSFDVEKIYENRDKLSDKDIQTAASRAENYNKIKKLYDDVTSKSKSDSDTPGSNTSDGSNKETTDQSNTAKRESKAKRDISSLNKLSKNDTNDNSNTYRKYLENKSKETAEDATKRLISDASNEVREAVNNIPKSNTLKKAAAREIAKEVGPELDEVISTFNDAMIAANQKRLDEHNKSTS